MKLNEDNVVRSLKMIITNLIEDTPEKSVIEGIYLIDSLGTDDYVEIFIELRTVPSNDYRASIVKGVVEKTIEIITRKMKEHWAMLNVKSSFVNESDRSDNLFPHAVSIYAISVEL